MLYCPQADIGRLALLFPVDWNVELFSEYLDLFHSCRTLHVSSNEQGMLPSLVAKEIRQLAATCCFTAALEPDHHYYRGTLWVLVDGSVSWAHEANKLVVYNLDYLLFRSDALNHILADSLFLDFGDEILGDLIIDICGKKSLAHFAQTLGDILLGKPTTKAKLPENPLQTFANSLKHSRYSKFTSDLHYNTGMSEYNHKGEKTPPNVLLFCLRGRVFFPYALDLGTKGIQLFLYLFVTPVNVIDAGDFSLSLGHESGKHERR